MPWYIYALASAVLLSLVSLIEKSVLSRVHSIGFSMASSILTFLFSIPLVFFIDFSEISSFELFVTVLAGLVAGIAFLFVTKALRHMEISTIAPLLALNPGAAAISAFIFLGEKLTLTNILGIILMVIGSYVIALTQQDTVKQSIKNFFKSKYIVFVFVSVIFYAIGSVLDRFLMFEAKLDPLAFLFIVHLVIAIFFFIVSLRWGVGVSAFREAMVSDGYKIALISILTLGYRFFQLEALKIAFVGLVSSIKRSSSFITTVIGGEFFHENNVQRKTFASLVIILGCLLVVL